jgi:hypothetical protein
MSLRIALGLIGIAAATLASACANQQSLREAAHAACVDEGVQPGAEMDACVEETEDTLRRAREYRPPPPPPPPQHHR